MVALGIVERREVPPSSLEDDDPWSASLETWRTDVHRLTGNPVEVLEVSAYEAATKLTSRSQVWADIRRDGRIVHGLNYDELIAAHVG